MHFDVLLHFDTYFQWPSLDGASISDGYCHGLSKQIGILSDGRVVPYCLDKDGVITLGNLHDQSLYAILTSTRATAITKGFVAHKAVEPLCKACTYKERFEHS